MVRATGKNSIECGNRLTSLIEFLAKNVSEVHPRTQGARIQASRLAEIGSSAPGILSDASNTAGHPTFLVVRSVPQRFAPVGVAAIVIAKSAANSRTEQQGSGLSDSEFKSCIEIRLGCAILALALTGQRPCHQGNCQRGP